MEKQEDFFKVYSNIPIKVKERRNVVVVIDNQAVSWSLASQEIKNNTKLGQKLLKILKNLEII